MPKASSVIIASLVGFVAGILLAPKSGKETIEDLKAKGNQLKSTASDNYDKISEEVKEGAKNIKNIAQNTAEDLKVNAKDAKSVVDSTRASLKSKTSNAADDINRDLK